MWDDKDIFPTKLGILFAQRRIFPTQTGAIVFQEIVWVNTI